jgi:hypothetical protein
MYELCFIINLLIHRLIQAQTSVHTCGKKGRERKTGNENNQEKRRQKYRQKEKTAQEDSLS